MPASPSPSARIRCGFGPRDLEHRLLEELAGHLSRDPGALARPLRIVVPSQSLRIHVARRLAGRFAALAGVRVQTLHGLAVEAVQRAGAAPADDWLYPVAVRQCARREPALREQLDPLLDGYGVVEAAVSDLLDAGFEAAHEEGVADALEATLKPGPLRDRAHAVLRVAGRVGEWLERAGAGHRSSLFRAAQRGLEQDAEALLPTRRLWLYGFADATGVQADLIDTLLRRTEAALFVDRPPDPAEPGRTDAGVAFGERFIQRLGAARLERAAGEPSSGPPRVRVLHAPGPHAEVRAVAQRLRARLDAGAQPEELAVVARHLDPYRTPLRLHLRRLGIPFSGLGHRAPPGPAGRRLASLLALLRRRARAPAERWLDALVQLPGRSGPLSTGRRADLLLALHVLGVARLDELDAVPPGQGDIALPVRLGLAPADSQARGAPRRRLPRSLLDAAVGAARRLCAHLESWPARAPVDDHRARLRELVGQLGWRAESDEARALAAELLDPGRLRDVDPDIEFDDFLLLAERSVAAAADGPVGGEGGGVQLLDVMEARGRTFAHLFVVGLSREAFPRTILEDPLLPDGLRERLRDVLELLPVKRDGHDEERFLFAQLLAAAPEVTLSAPLCDEDGKARPVSPLLERLRWGDHVAEAETVPGLQARPVSGGALRPAHEHALLAGLHGSRGHFERVLALALEETSGHTGGARETARARCAVLRELDPSRRAAGALGPYFGFVGAPGSARDPRRADVYVTAVEGVARCPWQTFVERLLRVEPLPDAHAELPSADRVAAAPLLGQLVHRVLEEIVRDGAPRDDEPLEKLLERAPRAVPWPDPQALESRIAGCASEVVRSAGIGMPGYAQVLALQARAHLEQACALDWPGPGAPFGVLGAEVRCRVALPDGRALHFKADRVDAADGALRFVDYKTGRPASDKKSPAGRARDFARQVASGELLQAAAYARAGAAHGAARSEGRYLYLRPEETPERVFRVDAGDAQLGGAFDAAVAAVQGAYDRGSFAPRLMKPGSDEEHYRCERCTVKDACLRGDSGARRRLADWLAGPGADEAALSPAERALRAVWRLAEPS
jgi:RecB family exonuclease